ncbi:MAG: HAD-IC family P-type ATPase [Candidatus Woesebacteria bacterium]
MSNWHLLPLNNVFVKVHSDPAGLQLSQVVTQRKSFGPNTFPSSPKHSVLKLFFSQFFSPLIFILIVAAILVAFIGEKADSVVIFIILTFNAIIGTYQEGKAEATLDSLKHFSTTTAIVIREGNEQTISDEEIVVGDLIIIREGEKVPADARIITANVCFVDESSLTGESAPVYKEVSIGELSATTPLSEQHTMLFRGTYITRGNATAVVVSTGKDTVIGKIALQVSAIDTNVPLKGKIQRLSKQIMFAVAGFSVFFLVLSTLRGYELTESIYTIITLCVSLIPEGLPIILTLVLASSVYRMSKRNALVKKLAAVEALGQASVIAVDKTGTITLNELTVEKVYTADGNLFTVTGQGYENTGNILQDENPIHADTTSPLYLLSQIAKVCTQSKVSYSKEEKRWHVIGEPTEAALLIFGNKYPDTKPQMSIIQSDPFDYKKKYSAHLAHYKDTYLRVHIGAPEVVLGHCILPSRQMTQIQQQIQTLTSVGLRVVAIGALQSTHKMQTTDTGDLEFLGLVAMRDSIHPEARDAVLVAKQAGIKVCMITGDHEATALSIAKEVGIYTDGNSTLTGKDIEQLSPTDLQKRLRSTTVTVFARVTPEHKLKIIAALRANGETVAMTGDGVNDAASLVAADLGIAMGKHGTEVAKEAADIVLLDDNFKSITAAIREGRSLYLSIKNVILYLLSTSVGEAMTIAGALLLGFPTPLLPVQILWLNFVTDGFLDVALSMEPKEKGVLGHSFARFNKYVIDRTMVLRMVLVGFTMSIGSLFVYSRFVDSDPAKALTLALTTMAAFQWFNAWNCRSATKSLTELDFFGNKPLLRATILIVLLHILALHTGFMQRVLHTTPLSLLEWCMCIGIASTIILIEEIRKAFARTNPTL